MKRGARTPGSSLPLPSCVSCVTSSHPAANSAALLRVGVTPKHRVPSPCSPAGSLRRASAAEGPRLKPQGGQEAQRAKCVFASAAGEEVAGAWFWSRASSRPLASLCPLPRRPPGRWRGRGWLWNAAPRGTEPHSSTGAQARTDLGRAGSHPHRFPRGRRGRPASSPETRGPDRSPFWPPGSEPFLFLIRPRC